MGHASNLPGSRHVGKAVLRSKIVRAIALHPVEWAAYNRRPPELNKFKCTTGVGRYGYRIDLP